MLGFSPVSSLPISAIPEYEVVEESPAWRRLFHQLQIDQDAERNKVRIDKVYDEIFEKDIEEIAALVAEDDRRYAGEFRKLIELLKEAESLERQDNDAAAVLLLKSL